MSANKDTKYFSFSPSDESNTHLPVTNSQIHYCLWEIYTHILLHFNLIASCFVWRHFEFLKKKKDRISRSNQMCTSVSSSTSSTFGTKLMPCTLKRPNEFHCELQNEITASYYFMRGNWINLNQKRIIMWENWTKTGIKYTQILECFEEILTLTDSINILRFKYYYRFHLWFVQFQYEISHQNQNNKLENCTTEINIVLQEIHWDLLANFP